MIVLVRIGELPPAPLAAAAAFHRGELPRIEAALAEASHEVTLVFPPADHTHRGWRLAAVQSLTRAHAPRRVNAIVSDEPPAIAAAERFLRANGGVTGQLLVLDGVGAGSVVS
ncbi:MAG: hypothetical protein JF593_03870 [Novosphingobium sp.]|nr:hypothetical protein [Novosphingobium sp.]